MTAVATPSHELTGHQIADRLDEITNWIRKNLWITDKDGKLRRLNPNAEQNRILAEILKQEMLGLPVRIIILKARKVGCSTIIEAYGYYKCHHVPNTRALVTAQDDDACITLFMMTGRFHENNPEAKDLRTTGPGRRELWWASPNSSRFSVQTAGKRSLGKSDTIHYLHCSEVPSWPQQKETLTSVLNAVPDNGGIVVLESTAHGFDEFKDRWDRAIKFRKQNPGSMEGFTPLFFPWLLHKHYLRVVPDGYKWGDIDEYETELKALGASDEQLYWRRMVLDDKCGGDPQIFMQEFPATAEQAFLTSGRMRVPVLVLQRHQQTAMEAGPGRRFRFDYDHAGKLISEEGDWPDEYWELWEMPDRICGYTIGGDVSEGLLSDPANPRSNPDRTTAFILNRRTMRQVGRWNGGSINETDFGREMAKAAIFYNRAWCSPEVNNTGKASVLVIAESGYDHLYQRRSAPESIKRHSARPVWGWKTTGGLNGTRDLMIADWLDICRPRKGKTGWDGRMYVRSVALADEETTFIIRANGRVEHSTGKHDDEIFAAMIAYQLHLECDHHEIQGEPDAIPPTDLSLMPPPPHHFVGGTDPKAAQQAKRVADMKSRDDDDFPSQTRTH